MTLTNHQKPKQNTVQRKRGGSHHRKTKDYHKAYWPYLPIVAVIVTGLLLNTLWLSKGVLNYAIDTTPSGLLAGTNQERTANGLGALAINSALASAANAKAQDMVNRNYWSHNTPDGEEPWVFITAAGYQYKTAGENLAYGFATSADTIAAWMNSPGHRANILNATYTEVGFGIANSANYQSNGNQTVVVAMYASPQSQSQPAVQSGATQPKPTAPVASNTPAAPTAPAAPVTPTPTEEIVVNQDQPKDDTTATQQVTNKPSNGSQNVSRVQVASSGGAPWSIAACALIVVILGAIVIIKHGRAWHKVIVHGEKFILKHKFIDTLVVVAIVGAVLLVQTVGFIQ